MLSGILEYSGPLYITGQTWHGITITTVYLIFGLQEIAKENNGTKNEKDSVVKEYNDGNNNRSDDGFDNNCNKHNDKNKEFDRSTTLDQKNQEILLPDKKKWHNKMHDNGENQNCLQVFCTEYQGKINKNKFKVDKKQQCAI